MSNRSTVILYEVKNALRSRWLYLYCGLLGLAVTAMTYLSDDPRKSELALVSLLSAVVPLVSILFTTTYWYSSERFTELLLSQPVSRGTLFYSRLLALAGSLCFCLALSLGIPSLMNNVRDAGLLWLLVMTALTGSIFSFVGTWIATSVIDRMWGIGLALAVWFYFVALHDAGLLLILFWFRDYPLERIVSILCGLNPLGLLRVTLLLYFDAPLLLGHSGALIRRVVETGVGYWYALGVAVLWLVIPATIAARRFGRRDF